MCVLLELFPFSPVGRAELTPASCPSLQAKNAFDSLNGFHLMDRYLVGAFSPSRRSSFRPVLPELTRSLCAHSPLPPADKAGRQGRPRAAREGARRAQGQAQHSREGVSSRRRSRNGVRGRRSYVLLVVTLASLASFALHRRVALETVHVQDPLARSSTTRRSLVDSSSARLARLLRWLCRSMTP